MDLNTYLLIIFIATLIFLYYNNESYKATIAEDNAMLTNIIAAYSPYKCAIQNQSRNKIYSCTYTNPHNNNFDVLPKYRRLHYDRLWNFH